MQDKNSTAHDDTDASALKVRFHVQ